MTRSDFNKLSTILEPTTDAEFQRLASSLLKLGFTYESVGSYTEVYHAPKLAFTELPNVGPIGEDSFDIVLLNSGVVKNIAGWQIDIGDRISCDAYDWWLHIATSEKEQEAIVIGEENLPRYIDTLLEQVHKLLRLNQQYIKSIENQLGTDYDSSESLRDI